MRDRRRGHPSTRTTFRCPDELRSTAEGEGRDLTEGMITLLDRAVDSREALGDLFGEVQVRAHREGITEGEALGRFAREAIARKRR